ncbi:MAG: single-stranded DNA-binding protein [Acetobacter peroxydans]|jgi:single-strand DNA-binding protein|uniref:Single-stranded DNA-binding protein n=1 Tax=Acetobacter peroxydans TaxID=104098 RepID=A0A4Y3TUQ2_9PROT|nr:single-stranded DNA-binding protein [Acetobacter peroxydans]MCH4092734.1 single-stranded DNA-binding protein [Acetobacter peroxydans]MCI2008176.1 single-stranded DNA-binding protein [Acetobacter peroxydans]MCI2077665.1 single-stranded DNA-binding protein [Acetobacter peroxydans]NHO16910.1 single-stranded DNA-binding protein [Acetobacter peroxydans]GBR38407.1 single-strand DNA binding protein Ssb [Acetobacter peroxydans NBRC 13755]
MAGSVNKVILVGNLGKDPEVRNSQSGAKIVSFPLATSDTWNDRASGERRERTEWHRIVIFNERLADVAERFLRKGRKVYLEGSLQTRKWTDQGGQERFTTEVIIDRFRGELTLLDSRQDGEGGGGSYGGGSSSYGGSSGGSSSYGGYNNGGSGNDYGSGSAAPSRLPAPQRGGNAPGGWDASGSSDLDDEIPF